MVSLEEHPGGDQPQGYGVDQGGEHIGALIAEGPLDGSGLAGEPDGEEGQRDRRAVGEHVQRVRYQGETSRDDAADDFGHHVRQDQDQRNAQPASTQLPVVMTVAVVMTAVLVAVGAVVVLVVMSAVVVLAGTALDGEVKGMAGGATGERAAQPGQDSWTPRRAGGRGLRERRSERGDFYIHDLVQRI